MANYGSILGQVIGKVGKRGGEPRLNKSSTMNAYKTNIFGNGWETITNEKEIAICSEMCKISAQRNHTDSDLAKVKSLYETLVVLHCGTDRVININPTPSQPSVENVVVDTNTPPTTKNPIVSKYGKNYEIFALSQIDSNEKSLRANIAQRIDNFFKEFAFSNATSYRFLNTLGLKAKKSIKSATDYVKAQLTLLDLPSANGCIDKMKSDEWKSILNDLASLKTTNIVNDRLTILFGPAGTGKTTKVLNDYPNIVKFNCNPSLIPSDIMEDFELKDSVSNLALSSIVKCAIGGEPILLDEIGALSPQCLETLQTLTDNTTKFVWKGQEIEIKKGFKIIGTMNVEVNGRRFTLPEPLVDRAEDLIEYIPTYDMLGMAF